MKLVLKETVKLQEVEELLKRLQWMGFQVAQQRAEGRVCLSVVKGADSLTQKELFSLLPGVEKVVPIKAKYKLASRETKNDPTVITIKGKQIGGGTLTVMAGPCAIESFEQMDTVAKEIAESGATVLRGGAFKPRTSPYDFQGMGEEGLQLLKNAGEKYGLITVSEVLDADQVDIAVQYVDILQVGARNMQNFALLKKLGKCGKPVLLKRGFSATYQDFLMAAEYILGEGNPNVILCERGIRTFETHSRNTLDVAAIPMLQELTHLPIIIDPSHGTGMRTMVAPLAKAGVAAGADGLMIEVHPQPDKSVSDAAQTISCEAFSHLMQELRKLAPLFDKVI
jgi:3-deoxy-7-phosphoheptulonate synthase